MRVGSLIAAIVTFALIAVALPRVVPAQLVPARAAPATQVIVKWRGKEVSIGARSTVALPALTAAERRVGVSARSLRLLATGGEVLRLDRALTKAELADFMTNLGESGQVEYVEADVLVTGAAIPNDERYGEQWALFDPVGGMNLPAAWDRARGAGVVVAVVDSGYLPHADLTANTIVDGYDFISDSGLSNDGDGRDGDALDPGDADPNIPECASSTWHGMRVAGTIAALTDNFVGVAGVAHGARILPVRALGRCNTGFISDIADAVVWSAGGSVPGAPTNVNPAKVINLSFSSLAPCSATMQAAASFAEVHGAVVVAAAGNESAPVADYTPANCSGVVSVVALNRDGAKSADSNFGEAYIAAPGQSLSTANSGISTPESDTYEVYWGTSAAAAHVSGVAALIASRMQVFRQPEVKTILTLTARAIPGGCSQGCGSGIVDAAAALALVDQPPRRPDFINADAGTSTTGNYSVTWDAPPLTTYYFFQRSKDSVWEPVRTLNEATVAFASGASPPALYSHRVQACNDQGCSEPLTGADVKVINPALIPPRPAPIVAAPRPSYTGRYSVTWSATLRATDYVLQHRHNESSWLDIPVSGMDETTIEFEELASGDWSDRLKACNFHGCSDWTSNAMVSVYRDRPQRPSTISVTPATSYDGRHTVVWSASPPGVMMYVAEHGIGQTNGSITWVDAVTIKGTSKTWTGEVVGRHYHRVKACNPNGCSDYRTGPLVRVAAPLPPTSISASPRTSFSGSYTVSWPAAPNAHHYVMQRAHPSSWGGDIEVSGTSRAFSNLGAGDYRHRVKSCNAQDECGSWVTGALVTVCNGECQ